MKILKRSFIIVLVLCSFVRFSNGMQNQVFNEIFSEKKSSKYMAYLVGEVINKFAGKKSELDCKIENFVDYVKVIELKGKNGKTYRFFGIHKDKQKEAIKAGFKQKLLKIMGLKGQRTVQLIGDSKAFTKEGTAFGKTFLKNILEQKGVIEYGYTGYNALPGRLDINSFVNEYADKNPKQAFKVVANVLGDSKKAIIDWGCYVSANVVNLVVVYNEHGMGEKQTHFGDDIVISDAFLDVKHKDEVICMEGGIQSFLQVSNSMALGLPIKLISGLRTERGRTFFSTAEFILKVKKLSEKSKKLDEKDIINFYETYEKDHEAWDKKRKDAYTKATLFKKAMKIFVEQEAYKRINSQCRFFKVNS